MKFFWYFQIKFVNISNLFYFEKLPTLTKEIFFKVDWKNSKGSEAYCFVLHERAGYSKTIYCIIVALNIPERLFNFTPKNCTLISYPNIDTWQVQNTGIELWLLMWEHTSLSY